MNSVGNYGCYPPNFITAYDPSGLYLTPDYFKVVSEKWWRSQNLFQQGTQITVDGVTITPKYEPLPAVSWNCGCEQCVLSVQNFLDSLNQGNGLFGATISSYGPIYNNLLTSGRYPSIQVLAGNNSTPPGAGGPGYSPENGILYSSMYLPLASGGGGGGRIGSGLLPTPLPMDYMGHQQQVLLPGSNGFVQGNNYPAPYPNAMQVPPNSPINQGKGFTTPKNAGFADVEAKSKLTIDHGNDQR